MRPQVSWMSAPDDAILEFFEEKDIATTPKTVFHNLSSRYNVINITYNHLKRRMRDLESHGLLEKIDGMRGGYQITEKGRRYLAGELSRDDLEDEA